MSRLIRWMRCDVARCGLDCVLHCSLSARPSLLASVTDSLRALLALPDFAFGHLSLHNGTAEHVKVMERCFRSLKSEYLDRMIFFRRSRFKFPYMSTWSITMQSGFIEPFNGKLRDELLNTELFDTLLEARVLIERWRVHYNTVRLHSSLGYRPPALEAVLTRKTTT